MIYYFTVKTIKKLFYIHLIKNSLEYQLVKSREIAIGKVKTPGLIK
jgi:hypothetical protein